MSQTPTEAPQLSGKMFLFERPELLNKEQHGHLGMNRADKPFEFCASARATPLTISEFVMASKNYPIVFMSAEDPVPLAVLGLVDELNLFVDDDGMWEQGTYIPGYIRRYPFALAGETGGDRFAIVIDAAHPGIVENGEVRFFDQAGESSSETQQAIEYCKEYERDRAVTAEVFKKVQEFGLVKAQTAQYTPQGETAPKPFAQYFGIDEDALKGLTDAQFLELRQSGVLPMIYAQLMSLGNWRNLLQKRALRFNLTEDQILQQVNLN